MKIFMDLPPPKWIGTVLRELTSEKRSEPACPEQVDRPTRQRLRMLPVLMFLLLCAGFQAQAQTTCSLSLPNSVCSGQAITLTAGITGGTAAYGFTSLPAMPSLSFSTGVNTSTATASASVSVAANTVYTVTYTGSVGTASCTMISYITVYANPTINVTPPGLLCAPATANLNSIFSSNGSLSFFNDSGFSSAVASPGAVGSGPYYARATLNGCTATASISITVNPTPTASGTASPNPVCEGSTINFSSTSLGSPTAYSWSGGSEFNSTQQNPSFTAPAAGTYPVGLTVTNSAGCTNSAAVFTVTVNPKPTIMGSPSPNPVCEGSNITFTGPAGTAWSWSSSPAGFSSTQQNPSFTAPAAGMYAISLSVTNAVGCTNSNTNTSGLFTVTVNPRPTATGSPNPNPVCEGSNITFTGPAGTAWSWSSSPTGFSSTAQSPVLVAPGPGMYAVGLTVTNSFGCTNSNTGALFTVTVNAKPALTSFSIPTTVCEGSEINFTGPAGGTAYSWSGGGVFNSTQQSPQFMSAPGAGIYTISLSVTNALGCTNSAAVFTVTVNAKPSAGASAVPNPVCEGTQIQFNGSPSGVTYSWNSTPPGFSSTDQNPTFSSPATGNYTVSLSVTNAAGCTNTATFNLTVNAKPIPNPSATPSSVCVGGTIGLSANGGGTYLWNGPGGFTATTANPTYTSVAAGSVTFTITVTSLLSCTATAMVSATVRALPVPSPTATPSSVCVGGTISLSANDGGTYAWSGPGGFAATTANPTYTAVSAGPVAFSVTVTNTLSCTATASITATVNALPVPSPTATPSTCVGGTISLLASGGGSYAWAGPGGFTATTSNPTYTSVSAGGVTFSVTVTNVAGCTATATASSTVHANPTASGTASPNPVCEGSTINFSSTSSGSPTAYSWSGGGVFNSTAQNPSFTAPSAGTYTVTLTVTNAVGCTNSAAVFTVTVNAKPTVTGSPSPNPVCSGSNITFTGPAGTAWSWNSSPAGFSSTAQNPSFTAPAAGLYAISLSVTNAAGCTNSNSIALFSVTVNAKPTTSGTSASPNPVCAGSNITFTGPVGGTAWSWSSSPAGFSSTAQNPSFTAPAAGTYAVSLSVTNAFGCTNSAAWPLFTVTVNAIPTVTGTPSPNPVCEGSTINFSGSAGTAWSWNGTSGNFSSGSQNPSFTAPAAGTYTVSLTVTNAFSCTNSAAVFTVTVNAKPTTSGASASPNPVCEGSTINFTGPAGGSAWSWTSSPAGFSSTAQNPSFTAPTAGTYAVNLSVTNAFGCTNSSSVAVFSVTVNPQPTVSGSASPNPVCEGSTINFTGPSGSAWSWTSLPAGFSSNAQSPSLTAPSGGTYTVILSVTNAFGCTNKAGVFTVTVNPKPVPNLGVNPGNPVCEGSQLYMLAGVTGASYSWAKSGGFTSTVQNPFVTLSVTASNAGIYSFTVTSNFGCTATATISLTTTNGGSHAAGSNTPICAGEVLNLSATAGAGYSYRWGSPDNIIFNSTTSNPSWSRSNASGAMEGVYSVTISVPTPVCKSLLTTSVVIRSRPSATITGVTEIQPPGFCTTLTVNGGGGTLSYLWAPGAFTTSTIGPICSPGPYSVTVTKDYGLGLSCTRSNSVLITVFDGPSLMPSASSACEGTTMTLKTALDGASFSWSGPLLFSSTQKMPSIPNVEASRSGIYSVTVTSTSGLTASATLSVKILKKPILTNVTANPANPICAGSYVQFYVTCTDGDAANGVTYTWDTPTATPAGFVNNIKEPHINSITFAQRGRYSVTAVNSCFSSQWAYNAQVFSTTPCNNPTRLAAPAEESINIDVTPNPTDHTAVVEIKLEKPSKISLKLYEIGTGRLLRTIERADELDRHRVEVDMSNYQFGNYTFVVESNHGQASKKISKR